MRLIEKKLLIFVAALMPWAIAAGATDGPDRAASWTGFYGGIGLGLRSSQADASTTFDRLGLTIPPSDLSGRPTQQAVNGTAFRVGPYAGFNWQVASRWVLGIEGDGGFADQTTTLGGYAFPPGSSFHSQSAADSFAVNTAWDASLRGRAGFLLRPGTLVYGTGGAALLHYDVTSTCASGACAMDGFAPAPIVSSATRLGWTVGGGVETALSGHWVARADYRYADFGAPAFTVGRSATVRAFNPSVDTFNLAVATHTATFGLAYKFGDPIATGGSAEWPDATPGTAAPAAVSWTGFYVGVGLGLRTSRADAIKTSDNTRPPFNSGDATSLPLDGTAFRASPYVGYSFQVAPRWVTGVEGDFGFANQTTTLAGIEFAPGGGQTTNLKDGGGDGFALANGWDASLRGRLGFLATPTLLVYATGGVAWQHFDATSTCVSPAFCALNGFSPAILTFSATQTGWTAGGGIEAAVWGNWFARAEYRYADLGTASFNLSRSFTSNGGGIRSENFDISERTHTVTFGLAYKFN